MSRLGRLDLKIERLFAEGGIAPFALRAPGLDNAGPMSADDESRPKPEEEGGDESRGGTSPFGWVSLLIIAALVIGTWFIIQSLSASSTMQDCIQSGRRNCAPIDNTPP